MKHRILLILSALLLAAGALPGQSLLKNFTELAEYPADGDWVFLWDLSADRSVKISPANMTSRAPGVFAGTGTYTHGKVWSGPMTANAVLTLTSLTAGRWAEFDLDVSGGPWTLSGFTAKRGTYTGAAVTSIPVQNGRQKVIFYHNGTELVVWDTYSSQDVAYGIAASDETTAITTGTGKATFIVPHAMTLTGVISSVTTAPTGSTIIIDINEDPDAEGGTASATVLSTKLSIDVSERRSTTAASAAVISDTALAAGAEITIDFDQVGSTVAGAGVKVWIIGTR